MCLQELEDTDLQWGTVFTATHLQELVLVETVEIVLPLEVSLQQQVEQAYPDLAVQFGHLGMVLHGNRLPIPVDVLLQPAYRGRVTKAELTPDAPTSPKIRVRQSHTRRHQVIGCEGSR